MRNWDTPLGLARRSDKAWARADRLRKQAEEAEAEAEELTRRYYAHPDVIATTVRLRAVGLDPLLDEELHR